MIGKKGTTFEFIKDVINSNSLGFEFESNYIYNLFKQNGYVHFIGTVDNYLSMLVMNDYLDRIVTGNKKISSKFKILQHLDKNITLQKLKQTNKKRIKNERKSN